MPTLPTTAQPSNQSDDSSGDLTASELKKITVQGLQGGESHDQVRRTALNHLINNL